MRPFPGSVSTPRLSLRLSHTDGARLEHEMILESLPDAHDRPDGVHRPECVYVMVSAG